VNDRLSDYEIKVMALAADAIFGQKPPERSDSDLLSWLDAMGAYIDFPKERGLHYVKRDELGFLLNLNHQLRRYPSLRTALQAWANGKHYETISDRVVDE
jgi:hypothetical protein